MEGRTPRPSRNRFAIPSLACAVLSLPCLLALNVAFLFFGFLARGAIQRGARTSGQIAGQAS
jgi:type III secretory pathway component EscT